MVVDARIRAGSESVRVAVGCEWSRCECAAGLCGAKAVLRASGDASGRMAAGATLSYIIRTDRQPSFVNFTFSSLMPIGVSGG